MVVVGDVELGMSEYVLRSTVSLCVIVAPGSGVRFPASCKGFPRSVVRNHRISYYASRRKLDFLLRLYGCCSRSVVGLGVACCTLGCPFGWK